MAQRVTPSPKTTERHVGHDEPRSRSTQPFHGPLHPIAELRRTLGNRKLLQLIQAKRLTPEGKIIGVRQRVTAAGGTPALSQAVQRFGSIEHQSVANQGSGGLKYQKAGLSLDQGDLTMLRGDYFEEKDLLDFWQQRGAFGQLTMSQDEIIYAIHHATSGKDPRFGQNGPWHNMTFSGHVKKAVEDRYFALANKNYSHFANPGFGIDARGMPVGGAGATYREAHERAIAAAFAAGAAGMSLDDALIIEAMGQHFLTDAFAAGHVSTQRGKIEKDWDARYPNFPYQIINRIVRDMADFLVATGEEVGYYLPQKKVEAQVRTTLNEKLATKGQLTLGKFIGLVAHDYDNEHGLWLVNDAGHRWFGYGDGKLDRQPMGPFNKGEKPILPREIMRMAVRAGVDDIRHAYTIGKSGKKLSFPDLSHAVRELSARPAFPSAFYAPEMYMPRLDPAEDEEQVIDSDSIENLFETRIRRNRPSYRELIEESVRRGTIHDELQDIAKELPESQDVLWGAGTLHPKEAFTNTVIRPLEHDPIIYLIYVMRTG
jgi:hypothetical protein